MQQILVQPILVVFEKLGEAVLVMRGEKPYPRGGYRLVIQPRDAMMTCECLNPMPDTAERRIERLSMKAQPCQPQMVSMSKFGSRQPARMKRRQKLIVVQLGAGKHEGHKPIIHDRPIMSVKKRAMGFATTAASSRELMTPTK